MSYTVPQINLNQQFTQTPAFSVTPLETLVIGPQYSLFQYSNPATKSQISVGAYNSASPITYAYPAQPAGSIADTSFTNVYFDNAQAKYFPNASLGSASATVVPVTNYPNRISSSALTFSSSTGFPRSSVFSNRDVQAGDTAIVTDGTNFLTSNIQAILPATVAAAVGSITNASTNAATHVASYSAAVGGSSSIVGHVTNASSAYVGYVANGIVSDTYTFAVTTASSTLSGLVFSVSSASGLVNAAGVALNGSNILTLDANGSNSLTINFTGLVANTLSVGHYGTLTVYAAVTQVTPTVSGTYVGDANNTYLLTVVRGGPLYNGSNATTCARISIASTNVDSSLTVNAQASTPFAVGSLGLTAYFSSGSSNGSLVLNDVYTIPVTAAAAGANNILVLQDNLTTALLAAGSLTVSLYLNTNTQVQKIAYNSSVNYTVSSTGVTLNSGITITNSGLSYGSTLALLPVVAASVYVEHRDLIQDNTYAINSVNYSADVAAALGTVSTLNPLAQGVYDAASTSGGVAVNYIAIPTNDLAGYNAALAIVEKSNVGYSFVPLTFDIPTQDAVLAAVTAMSAPPKQRFSRAWVSTPVTTSTLVYNLQPNGSNWTATVADNPNTTLTDYTLVTAAGATFVTDGVRSGDSLFINFSLDTAGNTIYNTYTVATVLSQTQLVLSTALPAAVSVATKIQIQRNYTVAEQATLYASTVNTFDTHRVRNVFPDTFKAGTVVKPGYYLAATLAGLRSGVAPHQPLTNVAVSGPTDLTRSVTYFNSNQLNQIAGAGTWIVTSDTIGGVAYTRQQLTTDMSSLNTQEDSISCNADSISYALLNVLKPYLGSWNNNIQTLLLMKAGVKGVLDSLLVSTSTASAGPQLISYSIDKLQQSATFADRVEIQVTITMPAPINNINITLVI